MTGEQAPAPPETQKVQREGAGSYTPSRADVGEGEGLQTYWPE